MWKAYYRRQPARLFALLVRANREQAGAAWPRAVAAAAILARAAAGFGRSTGHYERFLPDIVRGYRMLGLPRGVNAREVARRELRWWVVRREIGLAAGDAAGQAITSLYASLYGVPEAAVAEAGRLRGLAAEVRDRGATADPDGPTGPGVAYWPEVALLLRSSYRHLKAALGPGTGTAPAHAAETPPAADTVAADAPTPAADTPPSRGDCPASRDCPARRAPGPAGLTGACQPTCRARRVAFARAADRRGARLLRNGPRRLSRVRAPLRARAGRPGRARREADPQRPVDRPDREARRRAREALPRRAPRGRAHGRRDRPGRLARVDGADLRSAEAETVAAMRGWRGRHLPGHLLRRALARPRRLPAPGRAPQRARRLVVRGRRHQAGAPRQGAARSSRSARTSSS